MKLRKGPVGALMDEFERAAAEIREILGGLTDFEFEAVRDRQVLEDDFRSIQTVVHHIVRAGHSHANYVRLGLGVAGSRPEIPLGSRAESLEQLTSVVVYWEATLEGRWGMTEDEMSAVEIQARWGPKYDLEQMFEHAVVHLLRHRRQIERFLNEPQFAIP